MLSDSSAVIAERYAWSGVAYSWAVQPDVPIDNYMTADTRLIAPELMVLIDTGLHEITHRGGLAPYCLQIEVSGEPTRLLRKSCHLVVGTNHQIMENSVENLRQVRW